MYLLPKPQQLEMCKNDFIIKYSTSIVIDKTCDTKVNYYAGILKSDILEKLGFEAAITRGEKDNNCICLGINSELAEDEYTLTIKEEGIEICGSNNNAILYGVQTLRQIISQEAAILPCLFIKDYPEIKNRGFYHDVTRGRIPTLAYLKSFADKLSYYKINQLQLYIEHSFLFKEYSEIWRDDTPLTPEEILELDQYCNKLNIELVPSLSSFGHMYKALRTKSYNHLCELEDTENDPFLFVGRMQHHTIDVSNDESFEFVKKLILEFIPLFTSNQFNICADETFDLGKGRSKKLSDTIGVKNMYIQFVKKISEFLKDNGKRTMFWGDIISGFPEAIKELPEDIICLNWGYLATQREEETKWLHEAGAIQYTCPGACGWNQFINLIEASYQNITRMCSYARKYNAIGVLNTDWGDFGHINHPEFSTTGMIYGAAFSWNNDILSFDEVNRQISVLEYQDETSTFVDIISNMTTKSVFQWGHAVEYMEMDVKGIEKEISSKLFKEFIFSNIANANKELASLTKDMYGLLSSMDSCKRNLVKPYLVACEGISLFNKMGATIQSLKYNMDNEAAQNPAGLAVDLEYWFREYKKVWHTTSKESELYRIQNVIFWYADLLRDLS